MRFGLINGQKEEAQPNLSGECPCCGSPIISKCGEKNVWHWSHKGQRKCDPWWENETEWHRAWKSNFPVKWQECVHFAPDGEKHIADVKTEKNWVIEFQHSYIQPAERRARNNFYEKLIWVVDGNRRPRFKNQFFKTLNDVPPLPTKPTIQPVFLGFSQLLQEWAGSPAPVFFDFGDEHPLWCLIPTKEDMWVHVAAIARQEFIKLNSIDSPKDFGTFLQTLNFHISSHETRKNQIRERQILTAPNNSPRHFVRQAGRYSRRRF